MLDEFKEFLKVWAFIVAFVVFTLGPFIFLGWLLSGCALDVTPDSKPASWVEVQTVLNDNCVRCHSNFASLSSLLSLRSKTCPGELLVSPANPGKSVLLYAVEHTQLDSCVVPAMPPKTSLPDSDARLIRAWISQGAPL